MATVDSLSITEKHKCSGGAVLNKIQLPVFLVLQIAYFHLLISFSTVPRNRKVYFFSASLLVGEMSRVFGAQQSQYL